MTTAAVPRRAFEALFSIFLIGMAILMFVRPKKDIGPGKESRPPSTHSMTRFIQSLDGLTFEYHYHPVPGLIIFFFLGFIASFLGIGGGSLIVPILAYLLNFPVFIATATSQFIVSILTLTGTSVHICIGSFHHGAHRIAALGIGVLLGAQLGAYLSNKVKGSWIIRSLALALVLVGVRMLFAALPISWIKGAAHVHRHHFQRSL